MHTYKYFLFLVIFFFLPNLPAEASEEEELSIIGSVLKLDRNS